MNIVRPVSFPEKDKKCVGRRGLSILQLAEWNQSMNFLYTVRTEERVVGA